MSSQARIDASRANGKRSRGPKTEAGKRRSSQNARRHGLLSGALPIDRESAERFTENRQRFIDLYQPQDAIESLLVDRMAFYDWRHYEAMARETALINEEVVAQAERSPKIAQKEPTVQTFLAIGELLNRDSTLDVLNRYASQFSFRFDKTLDALTKLRNMRFRETNLTFKKHEYAKRTYIAAEK